MTKLYTLLLASLIVLVACKSATKAYDHGNYTDAIEIAVKKLQKDPHDAEMKHVLQNAYKYAVSQHEEQIRNLSASNNDNRWEQIYRQYALLQTLYTNIHQSPAAAQAVKPVNYADYVRTYKEKTADAYYERGLTYLNARDDNNRETYRKAYYEFRNALNYKPGDFEIKEKLKEAKDAATVHVLVAPMDNYGGFAYSRSYEMRNFQNDLLRTIRYNTNNDFVDFFTEWDNPERVQPDEILELRLGTFQLGIPYDENSVRQVSKEVVVKEVVHAKDSVSKEYAKVTARITTTKRTLISTADLFINIRDARNRPLWNENLRTEHRWNTEFATYTGDERALSESDKTLLNRKERTAPREDVIVEELLQRMQSELAGRLRNYYSRY